MKSVGPRFIVLVLLVLFFEVSYSYDHNNYRKCAEKYMCHGNETTEYFRTCRNKYLSKKEITYMLSEFAEYVGFKTEDPNEDEKRIEQEVCQKHPLKALSTFYAHVLVKDDEITIKVNSWQFFQCFNYKVDLCTDE